jgi:hypothetical protein
MEQGQVRFRQDLAHRDMSREQEERHGGGRFAQLHRSANAPGMRFIHRSGCAQKAVAHSASIGHRVRHSFLQTVNTEQNKSTIWLSLMLTSLARHTSCGERRSSPASSELKAVVGSRRLPSAPVKIVQEGLAVIG